MTLIPTSALLIVLSPAPAVPLTPAPHAALRLQLPAPVDLRRGIEDASRYRGQTPSAPTKPQVAPRKRSFLKTVAGAIGGLVAGSFSGALIGERLQGPCNCDDPGLDGMVHGIWIGGIGGAILLGYLAGRP